MLLALDLVARASWENYALRLLNSSAAISQTLCKVSEHVKNVMLTADPTNLAAQS